MPAIAPGAAVEVEDGLGRLPLPPCQDDDAVSDGNKYGRAGLPSSRLGTGGGTPAAGPRAPVMGRRIPGTTRDTGCRGGCMRGMKEAGIWREEIPSMPAWRRGGPISARPFPQSTRPRPQGGLRPSRAFFAACVAPVPRRDFPSSGRRRRAEGDGRRRPARERRAAPRRALRPTPAAWSPRNPGGS